MQIVERIQDLCIKDKTTIKALERALGIANGSIRRWDTQKPSVEKVLLVSKRFNVSLDWLVTGKEEKDLTQDEKKLVELYRNTNDIGQPLTMKHAEDVQQALPRLDQIPEQKSLNSQIG